jgi:diguanylate cyclase (GGDEF)-like protein
MTLDIFTLLLVLVLCNLATAAALWIAFAEVARDGLPKWEISLLVQADAWALFAAGDYWPGIGGSVAAHCLLSASFMLQAMALIEFQKRKAPASLLLVPPLIVAIVYALLSGDAQWRSATGNLLQAMSCSAVLWQLTKKSMYYQFSTQLLMLSAYGALMAIFLARAVASIAVPESMASPLDPSNAQSVSFLLIIIIVVLTSFGLLLMHKDRAEDEVHKLATMDPLTGVFNRRTFIDLAERELARCRRSNTPIRLLMMDLDHFKRVNDTLGHMVGDDVIKAFAQTVADCLRREDMLVRYGGEEFCVLLPGADAGTALTLAERIRAAIDNSRMQTRRGPVHITTSIGICGDEANAIDSIDSLLSCADGALYLAKAAGRNQVVSSLYKKSDPGFDDAQGRLI